MTARADMASSRSSRVLNERVHLRIVSAGVAVGTQSLNVRPSSAKPRNLNWSQTREAAATLGVGMRRIGQLIANGELRAGPDWAHRQLSRLEVETLALRRWNPRRAGADSYWLGTREAAE
jgi:hypothetical protein